MDDVLFLRICLSCCHAAEYSIIYKTDTVLLPKGKLPHRVHAALIVLLFCIARFLVLWDEATVMTLRCIITDALLSRQYENAARQGVLMYFDLCDLRRIPLTDQDLVILISNLLNNATEAARGCDRPEVYLRIKMNRREVVISVRNRVEANVVLADGQMPRTTKKDPGHGIGLANVKDVLDKYPAEYTLSCKERWFRFTCAIFTDNL